MRLGLLLLLLLLIAPARARAATTDELPRGHWNGSYNEKVRVCLDLLPQQGVRLTIYAPEERRPLVIEGRYKLNEAAAPDGTQALTMTVDKVRTKRLSNCRKYWLDSELPSTNQLGVVFSHGAAIKLTLNIGCKNQQSTVHLCIVSTRGTATCRDLQSDVTPTACKPSAPVSAETALGS